jgi:signal transduction histidine kinase
MSSDIDNNQQRLLTTLERLLAIEATEVKAALDQSSQLVAEALHADKVDAFLHDPAIDTLVAVGTSDTPLAHREQAIGMDRLPVANRGRVVEVFETGIAFRTGRLDEDPAELIGMKAGLGIRSSLVVALEVNGQRRGVLSVTSTEPDRFSEEDLRFLAAVAHWVGIVIHRAELVTHITQAVAERARRTGAEELITVLAHDLNNYLTPLIGRTEVLRRRATREGRTTDMEDAHSMLSILERLHRLIDNLLDAGRLEQGLFGLSVQPVNIAALAHETADSLRSPQTDIVVRGPDELIVEADRSRLQQALENLLSNALKHTPTGVPVVVEVHAEAREDGAWAMLTVRDQGPGIPAALLPQLFNRFMIGPASKGLGLGLYLARGIAQAHGGTLTVDSYPGAGTTFHLALPALDQFGQTASGSPVHT